MRTTLNLLFSPRKPKNYQSGDMPIYLRITVDGQRAEVAVSRKCDPNRWDIRMGRATGNKADAKSLNAFLDGMQTKIHEIHRQILAFTSDGWLDLKGSFTLSCSIRSETIS